MFHIRKLLLLGLFTVNMYSVFNICPWYWIIQRYSDTAIQRYSEIA